MGQCIHQYVGCILKVFLHDEEIIFLLIVSINFILKEIVTILCLLLIGSSELNNLLVQFFLIYGQKMTDILLKIITI